MLNKIEIAKILDLSKQNRWNDLLNTICKLDVSSEKWMLKLTDDNISDKEKQELITKWVLNLQVK